MEEKPSKKRAKKFNNKVSIKGHKSAPKQKGLTKKLKIKTHKLDDVVVRPLDLIAFKGCDFVSEIITNVQEFCVGDGDFTHVGIAVNREVLPTVEEMEEGEMYVWESTYSGPIFSDGTPNIEEDGRFFGVQIRKLDDVVRGYTRKRKGKRAKMAICRLRNNPWDREKNRKFIVAAMKKLHKENGMKLYEINVLGLLASFIPCLRPIRDATDKLISELIIKDEKILLIGENKQHEIDVVNDRLNGLPNDEPFLFCSELVALIYRELGIIDRRIEPSNVLPMDFFGLDKDGIENLIEDIKYVTMG